MKTMHGVLGACLLLAGAGAQDEAADPALAFALEEHDLYPENVAFDPVSKSWFLSSMGHSRILRRFADGRMEDFTFGTDDGLLSSVGMKVDAKRRVLWVCTGRFTLYADRADVPARTGLLAYDIDEGTLLRAWLEPQPSDYHIFNDLVLTSTGEAYVTTTLLGRVYRANVEEEELETILQLAPGRDTNGITLGPDEMHLFLTVDRTLQRLELETGELTPLTLPAGEGVGVDGLYYLPERALVAVIPRANRVVRYRLDEALLAVEGVDVLVADHPKFVYPTTGAVVGRELYVLATSFANRRGRVDADEQHGDVLVYRLGLDRD